MSVRVRPGELGDLPGMVEIYNHYVLHTPATFEVRPVRVEERIAWMKSHLQGGRHRVMVAETEGGGLLGWATSSTFREREAYATTVESSVYCRPERVGTGVGARLYAGLFEALAGEDIERIVAGITLENPASVALHRRCGFAPVGTFSRVGRKFGRYWDVLWMERPREVSPDPSSGTARPPLDQNRGNPVALPPGHLEGKGKA